MTNWKQDIALAFVLLGLSAFFFLGMEGFSDDARHFPEKLSLALGVLALCMLGNALRRHGEKVQFLIVRPYGKVFIQVAIIALFALSIRSAGYALAGFFLCLVTTMNGGYPRKKAAVFFSFCVAALVFGVFHSLLGVPLPLGFLE